MFFIAKWNGTLKEGNGIIQDINFRIVLVIPAITFKYQVPAFSVIPQYIKVQRYLVFLQGISGFENPNSHGLLSMCRPKFLHHLKINFVMIFTVLI